MYWYENKKMATPPIDDNWERAYVSVLRVGGLILLILLWAILSLHFSFQVIEQLLFRHSSSLSLSLSLSLCLSMLRSRDIIHRGPVSFWCMIHVFVLVIISALKEKAFIFCRTFVFWDVKKNFPNLNNTFTKRVSSPPRASCYQAH